jgi:predicted RNA binding protein YcfA (HicA-like mRNA interferase family)
MKSKKSKFVIPYHGSNKEIPLGTFLDIIKQSKLPKELFL